MYPFGFTSIAEFLENGGFRVRIVNLAVQMLKDKRFDAELMIKRLDAPLFGIDLHWMVHSHGAIEVARLVKEYHPSSRIVFGGLSASYFYKELFDYPEVDYVIRGDSTEVPLLELMNCLKDAREPADVPNLVWRDRVGAVRENPFSHVPYQLDDLMKRNYDNILSSVVRFGDLLSHLPSKNWLKYPITVVLTCRGCTCSCVVCGGSAASFRGICNRKRPAFRSPLSVVRDIKTIERFSRGPIFVLGDLRQGGKDYPNEIFNLLELNKVKNPLIFELFSPAGTDLFERMRKSSQNFSLEVSPESHDPEIRRLAGKKEYSNSELETTIGDALEAGCRQLDIFFMIGLPKQTRESVLETVDYCEYLMRRFSRGRVIPYIAPYAPFLDPGSIGFEDPSRYGYRLLFKTLEEHRNALTSPSWKYTLNYETDWLNRDELVEVSYEALIRVTGLKSKYERISKEAAGERIDRLKKAHELEEVIKDLLDNEHDEAVLKKELSSLKSAVDEVNLSNARDMDELELPLGIFKFRPFAYLFSKIMGYNRLKT